MDGTMTRTALVRCVALLLALVFVACGGGGSEGPAVTRGPSPSATPSPTQVPASPPATPSPTVAPTAVAPAATPPGDADTDAPLPDSIRELLAQVAEVRELEAPSTMRALTVARADVYDTYLDLVSEEDRAELDETTFLYRLLGYLDEDEDLWEIQTAFLDLVLGFYSPDRKTLWVVTDREGVGIEELTRPQRHTLVHEIIHALQDYHFDLNATFERLRGNLDAGLAFTSVVEGDAVIHTDRHASQYLALPGAGGVYFLATASQAGDIPPSILREIYFPYTTGASWAGFLLATEGAEALNAFLVEPPPATTFILHRDLLGTGWEPEALDDSFLPAGQIREHLGGDWRVRLSGSLGEFHLANYLLGDAPYRGGWLELRIPPNAAPLDAAEGWAGDRYFLLEDGDERVLVARVRFVDAGEASEFVAAHENHARVGAAILEAGEITLARRPDGNVVALTEPVGRDVLFAIGTNAEVARAALEALVRG